MNRVHIQLCRKKDLQEVRQWLSRHENRAAPPGKTSLNSLLQDDCLLLARSAHPQYGSWPGSGTGKLLGVAGLDLPSACIQLLALEQVSALPDLLAAIEQLAVSFGMQTLKLAIKPSRKRALVLPAYRTDAESPWLLQHNLSRRLTAHARKTLQLSRKLGIPADYGCRHRLRLQQEPRELASIGEDIFGREQFMLPQAAGALHELIRSASSEGVVVQPVSAFRSVDYQAGLLQNKLDKGQSMAEILLVSAAPGYSEHHSGRAVDLTTPGCTPLEEDFAETEAFVWLSRRAGKFGFRLSYPRGNRHGVAYEPWHWYYSGKAEHI